MNPLMEFSIVRTAIHLLLTAGYRISVETRGTVAIAHSRSHNAIIHHLRQDPRELLRVTDDQGTEIGVVALAHTKGPGVLAGYSGCLRDTLQPAIDAAKTETPAFSPTYIPCIQAGEVLNVE